MRHALNSRAGECAIEFMHLTMLSVCSLWANDNDVQALAYYKHHTKHIWFIFRITRFRAFCGARRSRCPSYHDANMQQTHDHRVAADAFRLFLHDCDTLEKCVFSDAFKHIYYIHIVPHIGHHAALNYHLARNALYNQPRRPTRRSAPGVGKHSRRVRAHKIHK